MLFKAVTASTGDDIEQYAFITVKLGLLLGTEAPVMTPNGVDFLYLQYNTS